jgi:formate/nitrite transporter FocA (FNT family)
MNQPDLESGEQAQAQKMAGARPSVIYESIRTEGEHQLSRTFGALWWSGIAAGLAISISVLCKGFLVAFLPDATWTPVVSNLGYTVGFLVVILGRMQLFTENTITPILSLLLEPTRVNLECTARLWAIVFAANMLGSLVAAGAIVLADIIPPMQLEGVLAVSRHFAAASAVDHLMWGIPAGFLIAALVWILPRMDGAGEILVIVIITYVIGLGGLSHVVAGSSELFILVFHGELGLGEAIGRGILPAFIGNVIGGTGMFAALTYAQVRDEV